MRKLACVVCGVLLTLATSAQETKLGFKAGLSLAKVNTSISGTSKTTEDRVTFHAGFYATIMASKKFGVQPELLYSGQGGVASTGELNLAYLSIPLMFRYNLAPWLNIQAGPQLSFLLSASDGAVDIGSQFKSIDFGGAIGVGLDLPFRINLSFRYINGFSNVSAVDFSSLGIPDPVVSNRVIQISLGYNLSGN